MRYSVVKRACALLLILALLAAGQGLAAETNRLSCGVDVTASPGREVLFPIYISGGADLAACRVYVQCDTSIFSLKQSGSGDYQVQPGDVTTQGSWGANTYGNTGWQFSWYRERNVKGEGVLCYLPLKVAANAPLGSYEVTLLCSAENTVDENGREVPFVTVNGSIEVVSAEPTIYTRGVELTPGATVDLPVYLRNDPGLMGLHLQFENNDQVEFVLGEDGLPVIERGELLNTGTFLVNAYGNRGGQIVWFNATPIREDGLLCILRLRIAPDAQELVSIPLTYQPSNTLGSDNKPRSLALAEPFATSETTPFLAAWWSVNGLHISGKLEAPVNWGEDGKLGILSLHRNGKMMRAAVNFAVDATGAFSLDLPLSAPDIGDQDRLSFYLLDAGSLAPLQERADIAIK